ncbi:MAG: hypothetical protein HY286_09310 [Planctomycetes bacterium]|nr:hypothetical protein [Planctomycetota bacterium]
MSDGVFTSIALDTSASINLAASGRFREIVRCLPAPVFMVDRAYREIKRNARTRQPAIDPLRAEIDDGVLGLLALEPIHHDLLVSLTGATEPDDLDDGESATIAFAAICNTAIVLDDKKPRRIVSTLFPNCYMFCTVDLFRRAEVAKSLGQAGLVDALFDALRFGRMRVLAKDWDWVVTTLGIERAKQCPSLPRIALRPIINYERAGRTSKPGRC